MATKVKYSVKLSDRWEAVRFFFEAYPDAFAELRQHVTQRDTLNFDTLTVRSLLEMVAGRTPTELIPRRDFATVAEWCALMNALEDGMTDFVKFMERTTPPTTPQQLKIERGMLDANIEEAILWTLRGNYSLHGLEDAQKMTIYEYKIARKHAYNEAIAAYNQLNSIAAVAAR
jgi:hypothetical protein